MSTTTNQQNKIFDEQISRKPDRYPWTQYFINAMWSSHWTPNEFSFASDVQDFKVSLTDKEREIIKRALSAIGQVEIAVKKFWARLGDNLPHPSINDLGLVMANVEVIHNQAYEKLLDVLGLSSVFEENLKLDIIRNRVGYLRKHLEQNYKDNKKQYIYSLILFTLFVENISLFSQFYIIQWFNRYKNVLRDTNQQVAYTRQEENLHAQVGIKLIQVIKSEYPELFDEELINKIKHEASEAIKYEFQIIDWIIGDYSGININKETVKEFIKNRMNDSLSQIGIEPLFSIDSDILERTEWLTEELYGNNMVDFFHSRPIDYAKAHQSFNEDDIF